MRPSVTTLALIVASAAASHRLPAQAQPGQSPPLRVAASSFATVEVHLNSRKIGTRWYGEDAALTGPSRIAISYGQPHARGRRIDGGLIPRDTVWRFGANMVTTLHSDVSFMLDTLHVRRGDERMSARRND